MSITDRIAIVNQARRDNLLQQHPVSSPTEHANDLTAMLLAAVAKGES